jgi:Sulfotransferase family
MDLMDKKIQVVAIAGTDQNGGTLLCRMLGAIPGSVGVGELGYVWDKGLIHNIRCGCGLPFRDCPFWTGVGAETFGGWDAIDAHFLAGLRATLKLKGRRLSHPLAIALLLRPELWPRYRESLGLYGGVMERLYRGIRTVSGAQVVIDSMKQPAHVFMLRRLAGVDLRVVHLVRDSRGAAYSGLKVVEEQGRPRVYRARRPPAWTGARWVWMNATFDSLAGLGVPVIRVRYESIVERPKKELTRIARFAGLQVGDGDLHFIHGDEVELPPDHLVAGNRVRLQTGLVRLGVDDAWRTNLDPWQARVVYMLTWPLLRRYGYAGREERMVSRPSGQVPPKQPDR